MGPVTAEKKAEAPQRPVELDIEAGLEQVSVVRVFLEEFLRPRAPDADMLARVTVAAHELLENAVKYSARPGARLRANIERGTGGWMGWVEVQNRAAREHLDDLIMTLQELEDPATALEMYQIDMICSAIKGDASGLGLARIRAELDMRLDCKVEDDMIRVTATATATAGPVTT